MEHRPGRAVYMHEYGTTLEHLAAIAVEHRRNAARNQKAQMREPITLADVMTSREISAPLRLLDCCLVSDGGAALVVMGGVIAHGTLSLNLI